MIHVQSHDFVLSVTGAAVPEDLSPSSTKVAVVEDGFIVHNISGIRAHIVTRMDGQGYDLTKRELCALIHCYFLTLS
jgi:mannosidase alpha-like ER degradation enhancer 1